MLYVAIEQAPSEEVVEEEVTHRYFARFGTHLATRNGPANFSQIIGQLSRIWQKITDSAHPYIHLQQGLSLLFVYS